MTFQSFAKFYILAKDDDKQKKLGFRQIKYDSKSGLGLVSDRTFLNMLEQSPLFLLGLWMHAVFISPDSAAAAGWLYLPFRAIYPVVFRMGMPWLFLSTFPNYFVVMYLIGTTVRAAMAV
eukprot:CAMPEP_0172585440 /NCGR_PEP_ID=MMETSP1068-20121228/4865_1 /TAXON_ID=35684 /ORGANISM="Pseudopedinella elastica, Strain CCMP716" /LENGTH=119 /DNA_ID=CAMNT_0013379903 /DNA_START=124 /DNA_END=483 /DNA_ORIENTATION=+